IGSTHGPTWVAGPMRRYHRCSYGRRMNFVLTFLAAHAVGVQIYRCDGTTPTFVAPRADLHGDNGKRIAIHFAGPTWKARDGSRAAGGFADRPIPWLLLAATSPTSAPDGDRLTHTTYVQRLATVGGVAPAASTCTAGSAGATAEVPYTADYVFWKETA